MSSLTGAPSLKSGPKKAFALSYDIGDDDDYIGTVSESEAKSKAPTSSESEVKKKSKKDKKKSKKDKEKKKHGTDTEDYTSTSSAKKDKGAKKAPVAAATTEEEDNVDYEDDFEEEVLDSDDYIPPVDSSPSPPSPTQAPAAAAAAYKAMEKEEEDLAQKLEDKLRLEKEAHERAVAKFTEEQAKKEEAMRKRQQELEQQIASLQSQPSVAEQVAQLVAQQMKQLVSKPAEQQTTPPPKDDTPENVPESQQQQQQQGELQRRRRRERERALALKRAQEEEAAHALFQRLAQDVREVFHELNLSVVAAEKERLIKDERYRKERELKERREEMERSEKLQKELKDREEREAKFWASVDQREERFRSFLEARMQRDDEEREGRLKRDLEDRATRVRNERELRDEMEKMERERRAKTDSDERERDNSILKAQLDEVKAQYLSMVEEVRRQAEADRAHSEAIHKAEICAAEKRHEAAIESQMTQQAKQLHMMETYTANAGKLQELIETLRGEMDATKLMNKTLTDERVQALQTREQQLDDQKALLNAMLEELKGTKQELEKERARVAGLYTKFELGLSMFVKNAEEDRRRLQEAQAHLDTLRQQADRDRKMMLAEVSHERKVMEQQQEEFLARKMEAMSELQTERSAIARERSEAAIARERQNRDETEVLKSLRAREEQYHEKLEATEADRVAISDLKAEQVRLYQEAATEREALRKERQLFELEKEQLLSRFEDIRKRAEDASSTQQRLRQELVEDRAAKEFPRHGGGGGYSDPAQLSSTTGRLHVDLARQRAILQKIGV